MADEYKLLFNAAAIRTEKKDKYGRWIPDDTVYPLKDASKIDVGQKFKAFKSFFSRPKPRFANIRPIPYGLQAKAEEVQSSLAKVEGPKPEANDMEPALLEQGAQSFHEASGLELHNVEEPIYQQRSILDREAYASTREEEGLAEFVQRSRFVETLTLNPPQQSIGGSLLMDWVEGIESASQSEYAMNDSNQEEALISFDESGKESQCGSETFDIMAPNSTDELQSLQNEIMQLEQFEQSDDLILLDIELEAPRANIMQDLNNDLANMCLLSSEIPQTENVFSPVLDESTAILDESNPLEAREMNTYSDSLVRFGLMEDKPRKVYRTMNQKASRPNSKSTRGSHSLFKTPVAAKGERPGASTPGKRGSNPVVSP